jgi:general L-amino acid transport system permease protein
MTPEYAALLTGLVLYTGAFVAETVRGSILAIPKAQTEAAAALGLNPFQRLRSVILPQALRIIIPPLTNQYLNLTKNSSLAVAVAFKDLFGVGRVSINQTGQAVPIITLVMLTYLMMSLTISLVMNLLNSRLKWGTR